MLMLFSGQTIVGGWVNQPVTRTTSIPDMQLQEKVSLLKHNEKHVLRKHRKSFLIKGASSGAYPAFGLNGTAQSVFF